MSALSKLEERALDLTRPDPGRRKVLDVSVSDEPTLEERPVQFATQRQYRLKLEINSLYWANDAQRERARNVAAEVITRLLYSDVLLPLSLIRQAAINGEHDRVFDLCCQIENTLRGQHDR